MSDVEELGACNPPAEDPAELKAKLERIANTNARLARLYFEAQREADGQRAPASVDLTPIYESAMRATGMSLDELKAAAANDNDHAEPFARPVIDVRRVARQRMKRAGVLEGHIQTVGDRDPIGCDALTAVRELLARPSGGIVVLAGGLGTRKTGSACWLLGQVEDGMYTKASHLLSIAMKDHETHLRLSRARAVVLDDLGIEVLDREGYWLATFTSLFDDWCYSQCWAVLTCNLTVDQFRQRYGERVVDRIRERGDFVLIGGESVRKGD